MTKHVRISGIDGDALGYAFYSEMKNLIDTIDGKIVDPDTGEIIADFSSVSGHDHPSRTHQGIEFYLNSIMGPMHRAIYGADDKSSSFKGQLDYFNRISFDIQKRLEDLQWDESRYANDQQYLKLCAAYRVAEAQLETFNSILASFKMVWKEIRGVEWVYTPFTPTTRAPANVKSQEASRIANQFRNKGVTVAQSATPKPISTPPKPQVKTPEPVEKDNEIPWEEPTPKPVEVKKPQQTMETRQRAHDATRAIAMAAKAIQTGKPAEKPETKVTERSTTNGVVDETKGMNPREFLIHQFNNGLITEEEFKHKKVLLGVVDPPKQDKFAQLKAAKEKIQRDRQNTEALAEAKALAEKREKEQKEISAAMAAVNEEEKKRKEEESQKRNHALQRYEVLDKKLEDTQKKSARLWGMVHEGSMVLDECTINNEKLWEKAEAILDQEAIFVNEDGKVDHKLMDRWDAGRAKSFQEGRFEELMLKKISDQTEKDIEAYTDGKITEKELKFSIQENWRNARVLAMRVGDDPNNWTQKEKEWVETEGLASLYALEG